MPNMRTTALLPKANTTDCFGEIPSDSRGSILPITNGSECKSAPVTPSVSRRKFVLRETGGEIKLFSNGETALEYFDAKLKDGKLYCLDEPENSLSPQKQIVLKQILEEKARYCGCQFVIATHSPFLMALEGAKIYDLDAVPVDIKKWWELPNTRTYYEFFRDNAEFFERTDSDRRG